VTEDITLENTLGLPKIKSAGGLVYNKKRQVLLIFKRGMWDLPKGRLEGGDSRTDTALREIHEESGLELKKLSVKGKLVPTWHTTAYKKKNYLKKTYWYLVEYDGDDSGKLSPEINEGIIDCRWISIPELNTYRPMMYSSIQYVIDFWLHNLAYK